MASLHLTSLFSVWIFLLCSFPFSSTSNEITLSLSPVLNAEYSTSLNRILNQKQYQNESDPDTIVPLSPSVYGAYAISLSFGTPPQSLPLIFDTSISLVWSPCKPDDMCSYCNVFRFAFPQNTSVFIPNKSSSAKMLKCTSQQCAWLVTENTQDRCRECQGGFTNCNEGCPPFVVRTYSDNAGSSAEYGIYLTETLNLPDRKVDGFVIGCSNMSFIGMAGFGHGQVSLPAQMGITKFSYCLVSDYKSSQLTLYTNSSNSTKGEKDGKLKYTPFLEITNPLSLAIEGYYYLSLGNISVGGVDVGAPADFLKPDSTGNGGLVVVTSSSLSFLKQEVYNLVLQEFEAQTKEYSRARDIEDQWGLKPCFKVPSKRTDKFPKLKLSFKDGEEMEVAIMGYFPYSNEDDLACMTFYTDDSYGFENFEGPSMILGNYQQQNIFMEFDLANDRLGFREQFC